MHLKQPTEQLERSGRAVDNHVRAGGVERNKENEDRDQEEQRLQWEHVKGRTQPLKFLFPSPEPKRARSTTTEK